MDDNKLTDTKRASLDQLRKWMAETNAAADARWAPLQEASDEHPYLKRHDIKLPIPGLSDIEQPRVDLNGELVFRDGDLFYRLDYSGKFRDADDGTGVDVVLWGAAESPFVIARDLPSALAIHKATEFHVVLPSGAHTVADEAKGSDDRPILIACDLGGKDGSWERAAIAAGKEHERHVVYPAFRDGRTSGSFADLARDEGLGAVKRQIDAALKLGPAARFMPITAAQAGTAAMAWLVKGLIPRRGLAVMYGPSGSGKSFLALDMLAAIADGREWFDRRTTAAPALYLALEGGEGMANRLGALMLEVGAADGLDARRGPFLLTDLQDEAEIIAFVLKHQGPGGIICIDTLAAAVAGMDENSAADMTNAIGAIQRIAAGIDGLVLVVAHSGKDASRGMRGHSSLFAAADAAIEVSGSDSEPRRWKARKVKDALAGRVHPFDLHTVELGHDADGDTITSCVIGPEAAAQPTTRAELAQTIAPGRGNMRVAWQRIGEIAQASPSGRVELGSAIDAVADVLTCAPKRKRERAETAVFALIAQNHLAHESGLVWLK